MTKQFIDVHMHCFTGLKNRSTVLRDIETMRTGGVGAVVVVGLVNTSLDVKNMWNLIPGYVENRGDPHFNEINDLLELTRLSDQFIIPFVDTRHLSGSVMRSLQNSIKKGIRGIKGIYLPDENNDIGSRGVPETLGITLQQYLHREWEIFSFAQDHDLPLLYHLDSRRYADVMLSILADFPSLRINFAHLGIGRKTFAAILDRYPNVYTDVANLLPHIRNNPASYRDFIMHYSDRVCLGSDAMLYQPETVLAYVSILKELKLPPEIEQRVLYGNPAKFLGSALQRSESGGL